MVIPQTQGNILVLSDAIQKRVCHFADPSVGVVSDEVRLVDGVLTHAHSEAWYDRYEHGLQAVTWQRTQRSSSRLGSAATSDLVGQRAKARKQT